MVFPVFAAAARFAAHVQANAHPAGRNKTGHDELRIDAGRPPLVVVPGFQILPGDQVLRREAVRFQNLPEHPQRSERLPTAGFRNRVRERPEDEIALFEVAAPESLLGELQRERQRSTRAGVRSNGTRRGRLGSREHVRALLAARAHP